MTGKETGNFSDFFIAFSVLGTIILAFGAFLFAIFGFEYYSLILIFSVCLSWIHLTIIHYLKTHKYVKGEGITKVI